ncbi:MULTISPECIES: DUF2730 family protein [Alteromonas]|uniref:DUF2730 family protein n=1 Tax=Alteromonas TaxID=226 RepID=UPI000ED60288|nr:MULTISPECIES: DUF2730 family protein [Alteromonas]HAD90932.1 hypothetical protein [Alteromonas macleodii]|tara:strand:+ start:727 stop:1116 length:390 start_codon:yes stop_codon:yes gene_type:complete
MEQVFSHLNDNWKIYSFFGAVLAMAGLYWLSKYFATKKELEAHVISQEERFKLNELKFKDHQIEHYKLRDKVHEIDSHVKHLPSAGESAALREEIARLNGRLEGMEPLFKQVLNNVNILFENELRGDKN